MKVILSSNFDSESYNEQDLTNPTLFLSGGVASALADAYNQQQSENSPSFARVVPNDYVLYTFEP